MPDHLNREQISALLDDPAGVSGGLDHIDLCPDCAREYEQMSRMRMALSGLPELEAPAGEWHAIQERLGLEPLGQHVADRAAMFDRELRIEPGRERHVLVLVLTLGTVRVQDGFLRDHVQFLETSRRVHELRFR